MQKLPIGKSDYKSIIEDNYYTYHNLKVFLKYFKIVMKTENG